MANKNNGKGKEAAHEPVYNFDPYFMSLTREQVFKKQVSESRMAYMLRMKATLSYKEYRYKNAKSKWVTEEETTRRRAFGSNPTPPPFNPRPNPLHFPSSSRAPLSPVEPRVNEPRMHAPARATRSPTYSPRTPSEEPPSPNFTPASPTYTPTIYNEINSDDEEDGIESEEEDEEEDIPEDAELWGDSEDEFYVWDHVLPTPEVVHLNDSQEEPEEEPMVEDLEEEVEDDEGLEEEEVPMEDESESEEELDEGSVEESEEDSEEEEEDDDPADPDFYPRNYREAKDRDGIPKL